MRTLFLEEWPAQWLKGAAEAARDFAAARGVQRISLARCYEWNGEKFVPIPRMSVADTK
jgi:hypothetical protein